MSAVLVAEHVHDSAEWHEMRASGIGASEISAVVGLNPWQSAFHLWHVKRGNLPPEPDKPQFKWGHLLEPLIADEFIAQNPQYTQRTAGTYAHPRRRWQLANVDRLLFSDAVPATLLECKSSRFGDDYGPTGTDKVPLHVRCQVMQQMDVFGFAHAWVAVLIGGSDFRTYLIDYSPDDATHLREAGERFWLSLQTDDEPPLDASESTYNAVRELHPDIDGTDVEINGVLYDHYHNTKTAAERAAAEARQAKSQVLDAMGSARRATVGEQPVLRRQPNKSGVSLYDIGETA